MNDITDLVEHLDSKFTEFRNELNEDFGARFDGIDRRFDAIDKRFNGVDIRFDAMDARFDGIDHRFDALENYMDEKFTENEAEHREMREQISGIYDGLDAYTKRADECFQELTMLSRKVDRHEGWHHQVAGKVGIELKS